VVGAAPELLLCGLLGAFVVGLARHGDGFDPVVDGWLGSLTTLLPALFLVARGLRRGGPPRRELLLLGTGALAWSLGGTYVVLAAGHGNTLPFPSWADLGFLCFPPLVFASVAIRVRRELRGVQWSVWLDSALGALGAATGLAVLLGPVLSDASGEPLAAAVTAAYPVADMLLVASVVGVVATCGLRPGRSWLWLLGGLLVFTVADVVYALRVSYDTYALGTPLDALWSLGLTIVAVGSRRSPSAPRPSIGSHGNRAALAVPALATVTALAVLVSGRWVAVTPVATVLATLTLVGAGVRTQLAFRQVLRLYHLGEQARTDSLTGLGNRRALHEHLTLRLAAVDPGRLAVLLLDLDHFKEINDTLGHHVGDELLRQLGPRLAPLLDAGDLIVRLGGDEFAVVVGVPDDGHPERVGARLLERLAEPFHLDGVRLRIGASIGVAMWPEDAGDPNGLVQRADVAMYAAKAAGGGVRRYDVTRDQHSRERLRTVEELRIALDADQLTVFYQPQCDVASGAVVGVEALVRWQHPDRGLLAPDQFLPLVERTGLMPLLTASVLRQSLLQCRRWRADGLRVGVSVNLSASSLLDQDLPEQVRSLLAANDLPGGALTLELTENTLMADPEQCRATLVRLKQLGVWLSIDDYGTGYCSLSYLQDLPVDELKLDRVFLTDLQHSRNAAIVRSTIDLAHALSLRLVAEGVEDQGSLDLLRSLGCDTAQGYHLSRPLPAGAMTGWLLQRAALQDSVR
jgi:diguanylate cyclase (GGDEF)-like protein